MSGLRYEKKFRAAPDTFGDAVKGELTILCPACGTSVNPPEICPGCGLGVPAGAEAEFYRYHLEMQEQLLEQIEHDALEFAESIRAEEEDWG